MSEAEHPALHDRGGLITVDEIRALTGAATPHFAQQLRNRVAQLIQDLPADHPARRFGQAEIERLTALGESGNEQLPVAPSHVTPSR